MHLHAVFLAKLKLYHCVVDIRLIISCAGSTVKASYCWKPSYAPRLLLVELATTRHGVVLGGLVLLMTVPRGGEYDGGIFWLSIGKEGALQEITLPVKPCCGRERRRWESVLIAKVKFPGDCTIYQIKVDAY